MRGDTGNTPHAKQRRLAAIMCTDIVGFSRVVEVLRLNPKFALEVHKERASMKDQTMLERH